MRLFSAAALFVIAASAASAADADVYSCTDHNVRQGDNLLRELYSYALFVEAADMDELPPWQCESRDAEPIPNPSGWDTAVPEFARLTRAELEEYGWSEIAGAFRERGRHIGAYERMDGEPTYVVCDNNPSNTKLFLTWSRVRHNIDYGSILTSIVVPVVLLIDFAVGASTQNGLRTATFHRNDDLSEGEEHYYPETVTAIPGTDLTKLRELQSSWRDLKGESCVFEFMVAFADRAWSSADRLYALAGHSLGGSVAQYVAQKLAPTKKENADGAANRANFRAYAFNAIGLDESRGANPQMLYSFYVKGDPVVGFGADSGRIQGGRVVQYTPSPTTGIDDFCSKVTFKWHQLSGVQEGLCDCMNGRGDLSITTWSSTWDN